MSDHQLTRYESLVRETPVCPASHGVGLDDSGESVFEDYSEDSGGSWIACRCGKQFQSDEAAIDHLVDAYGVRLRAKAYAAIRRVQDLAENAENQRVVEEMERLALTVEENTKMVSQFADACRVSTARFAAGQGDSMSVDRERLTEDLAQTIDTVEDDHFMLDELEAHIRHHRENAEVTA